MSKTLERHPLSAGYPDLAGRVWDDFLANVQAHGADDREIVLHEGKVLDGWQLYRACQELGVKFKTRNLPKGEDPEAFVEQANELRRHESSEMMQRRADARRERVADARRNGQSLRTIAEAEDVSVATVQSDLDAATVQGRTVEPPGGKVTGRDGKKRPATTAPVILCQRCQGLGQETPATGCSKCQAERAKAKHDKKKAKKKKKAEQNGQPTEVLDDFKTPVPKKRLAAWSDPWIQETFDTLSVALDQLLQARMAAGMNKRAKHFPFFDAKDFCDGYGFATNYIDQLIQHLKTFRPAGVCPCCEGVGCGECRQAGLVPRETYKALKEKLKGAKK